MRYVLPQDVTSPQDAVSNLNVLFDGGEESVSIARMCWFNEEVIGIRWNVALREWDDPDKIAELKVCLGMPVSRGYSTWFILPDEMFDSLSKLSEVLTRLKT